MASSYTKYETRTRDPDPKSCVLLVIDVQNYFSSMAKLILSNTLTTIDLCRRASIPVFFTRHCHKSPADYGMLAEWWNNDLVYDGTVDAELMPEIKRLAAVDEIIEKNTYSAFHKTDLQDRLVELGVKEVIVTGVMTNLCCETTAREAFLRGYRVFFSTDATATSDEELHVATLKNLAFGFAYLVDCNKLQAALLRNRNYTIQPEETDLDHLDGTIFFWKFDSSGLWNRGRLYKSAVLFWTQVVFYCVACVYGGTIEKLPYEYKQPFWKNF